MGFRRTVRKRLRFGLVLFLVSATTVSNLNISPVSASGALTLTVDYTPDSLAVATEVTPGNRVDLTAVAPVSVSGTTSQMVQIELEPDLVLTSSADIKYPSGWTVFYSVDGATWTSVAPTTTAAWALIRFVKAEGPLVSEGTDSSGRQIASTDANAAQPTSGQFPTTTGSSGDGWDVFFDDQGRLFNVWHHNGSGSNQSVDCYLRTGVRCHGTWPFLLLSNTAPTFTMHTNEQSTGVYDPAAQEIWFPTVYSSGGVNQVGFACIRTDDITLTNKWCGGSAASAFVSAGIEGNIAGTTCISGGTSTYLYDCTGGIAKSGNRIFSYHTARGDLMCVDISANNGAGAPCSSGGFIDFGASLADVSSTGNRWRPLVMEWGGRIYGNGGRYAKATCVVASTGQPCTGWTNARAITATSTRIFKLPTSQGGVAGVCFSSLNTARTCFDENGNNITSSLTTNFNSGFTGSYRSTYDAYGGILYNYKTRLYWGDANWAAGQGKIYCWDFALDTWCKNWTSAGVADTNYQIVLDPYNPNCLWSNSHDGIIQTYDTYTGAMGNCAVPAPTAVFDAGAALPRMACAQANAIQEWKSFALTANFAYTSATLTVKKADGTAIAGWTNVAIPSNSPKSVDLSALSVMESGQNPTFTVTFTGRTEYGEVSARTTAIGGSPELCLRPMAIVCPTGPVFQASQLAPGTSQVDATGSATAGATVTPFSPATATVNIGAMSAATCSTSLSGTALTTSGTPVGGALVTLTNGTGTPLTYPLDYADEGLRGQVISVVTNSSGQYSFPYVVPGSYAVRFSDVQTAAVTGTSVVGGTTTSENTTTITVLTSASKTLVAGTPGVINATYTAFPTLTKKFLPTTVAKGQISTLVFTLNNSAGNGAKSGLGFVDTLPQGLVVDTNANMMTTCPGGSTVSLDPTSMTATSGVITVTNASITSGVASCEYSIAVRADAAGTYTNDASNVSTTGLAKDLLATKVVTNDSVSGKFSCNTNMYHIIGSQLYQLNPLDTRGISYEIGPNTLGGINAIGFNALDGFMYGIATTAISGRTAGNLIKIDSAGVATDLGPISGVTTADMTAIVGGDFDGQGNLVVKKTGLVSTLYSINVSTRVATTITTSIAVGGADLAYVNGEFYSARQTNFYKITRSGGTSWTATARTIFPTNYADSPAVYGNGFGEVIVVDPNRSAYRITNPAIATASSSFVKMFDFGTAPVDGAMCNDVPVPTAQPDVTSGPLDTPQSINLLTNDIKTVSTAGATTNFDATTVRLCDPNSNPAETAPTCTVTPGTTITVSGVGSYVVDTSGVITFTPVTGYSGTPPPLGYQVADINAKIASSTYTPTVTNTTPTAIDDTSTGSYDSNQTIAVLTNDVAGSLGTLVPSSVRLCATTSTVNSSCTLTSLTVAGEGTYTVNPDGTVTFDPLPTFTGTASPVKYVVSDTASQVDDATLTPAVTPPPAPTAVNDTSSGAFDTNQTISPLTNDTPGTGASLVPSTVKLCATTSTVNTSCTLTSLTVAGEGTYTVNADGTVTFDPLPTFTGTASPVKYVVADNFGQLTNATITPTVSMPVAPTATPESKAVIPGGTATFTTVTGAGGLGSSPVSLNMSATCLLTPGTQTCDADGVVTIAGEGTYTLNTSTGVVTFVADINATQGSQTPISYRITDQFGQTATSTLTPVIPAPPVATNDTSSGAYDTNQIISILNNDIVTSPATLLASTVRLCATTSTANASCTLTSLTVANEGTYTVNTTTGVVTFDPLPTFTGTASPVKYVVADSTGQLTNATITPTVSMPAAPVATPESKAVIPGGTATFTTVTGAGGLGSSPVSLNTSATCLLTPGTQTCDADGVVTIAGEGTYTLNTSTGVVTFVADANATAGTKTSISYRITDQFGQTATSTLTPVIPAPPVAVNDTSSGAYDTNQTISPLTNDSATTPATLVASTVRLCANTSTANTNCTLTTLTVAGEGTYTVNANGTVTFDPLPTFTGTASPVKYVVADSTGQVVSATITPTVVPPPLPTAVNDTSSGAYDTNQTISPLTNDSATTPAALVASTVRLCATTSTVNANCTLTSLTVAGEGTYTVNADGTVTFDPLPTFTGTASPVKYVVTDILGRTVSATITPSVLFPPSPMATPETRAVLAGGTATFTTVTGAGGLGSSPVSLNTSVTCLLTPGTQTCDADGVVTIAGEGTYTLNTSTGVVTFVADVNATQGSQTPISYRITDQFGQTATSTLTPVIPAPPVAVNDTSSGAYDTNQTISPLTNDSATTPAALVASTVRLCATTSTVNANCTLTSLTVAGEGMYTVNANGTVTFDPLPTFTGTASPVKYVVADSMGQVVSATITPTVVPPPPPSARPETKLVLPGLSVSFSTVTNSGGLLSSVLAMNNSATCLYIPNTTTCDADGVIQIEGEGTFSLDAVTGVVTFTADANATPGTKTSITYRVTDILGQTVTSTLTPVIPTPPVAEKERLKIVNGVVTFSPLFGKKGLSTSAVGIVAKSACLIDPRTNRCDADGVVVIKGEGTYRLNKKSGIVTFNSFASAPSGNLTPIYYEVADRNGAKVRSTLQPFQTEVSVPLPATGLGSTSLNLVWSAALILLIGGFMLRPKKFHVSNN